MLKKLFAVSVAAIICLSMLSVTAFADTLTSEANPPQAAVSEASGVTSESGITKETVTQNTLTDGIDKVSNETDQGDLAVMGAPVEGGGDLGETELLLAAPADGTTTEKATADGTAAEKAAAEKDREEDENNLVALIVALIALVVVGVSITILARKKRK